MKNKLLTVVLAMGLAFTGHSCIKETQADIDGFHQSDRIEDVKGISFGLKKNGKMLSDIEINKAIINYEIALTRIMQ